MKKRNGKKEKVYRLIDVLKSICDEGFQTNQVADLTPLEIVASASNALVLTGVDGEDITTLESLERSIKDMLKETSALNDEEKTEKTFKVPDGFFYVPDSSKENH